MSRHQRRRGASSRTVAAAGQHPSSRFGSLASGSTERRYPEGTAPEERVIIDHSRENVRRGKTIRHPDGSRSTVLSGSVENPRLNSGEPTLVPFLWDGKIARNDDEAAERAVRSGKKYPAFKTHEEATVASKRISSGLNSTSRPVKPLK